MKKEPNQELLDKAYPIIDRIATSRKKYGAFAYYENTDIYQEVWKLCLEALQHYDSDIGPLENFLNRHIANRMKNLKRDKYFRPGVDIATSGHARVRMNLINALPLDCSNTIERCIAIGSSSFASDPLEELLCKETLEYIQERLSPDLLGPFEDLLGNDKVRKPIIDIIRSEVAEILIQREIDNER